ncbi:MAG: ribonuclease III [Halothermotrichaceae bacterium]
MDSFDNKKILSELEEIINLKFDNKNLLQRSLIHKSFSNENNNLKLRDNERLEFLGDSVLSIVISTYIFNNFPDYPEGELAKMRSVIVSEPILAIKAREINLGKFIMLGHGEELSGGRNRNSILADTMEALICAVYLDFGFETVGEFIINLFEDIIKKVEEGSYIQDYKTMLQEIIQQDGLGRPSYIVVDEKGPDHNKIFSVEVVYNKKSLATGTGTSKKEAEQNAARAALENMGKI